jgi:AraC-like DNA-binding protein
MKLLYFSNKSAYNERAELHSLGERDGLIMELFREIHQYDPFFPFTLMYREQWNHSTARVFHFHDWYELVYVHSGEGVFLINQSIYDMTEGEVYIVPGNAPHHSNPSKNTPYQVSVILFDAKLIHQINLGEPYFYLQAFEKSRKTGHYCISCPPEQKVSIERRLALTFSESKDQQRGYRYRVLNQLHQMLADLNSLYIVPTGSEEVKPQGSKSEIWLKDILVYIDNHLSEELTLTGLAKQALVSPDHFSRVFKELTGTNLPHYINMKRIIKAQGMITEMGGNIPYISDACGFQSISHFYRMFRKHLQMTPGEYQVKVAAEAGNSPHPGR